MSALFLPRKDVVVVVAHQMMVISEWALVPCVCVFMCGDRRPSSEEREEAEREVLAFEMAHQHRIEIDCDDGCPTRNDSGLSNDEGNSQQSVTNAKEGDESPNLSSDSDPTRLVINEGDAEDEEEEDEQ